MSGTTTRGVLFVHSTPAALCPHVEWATGSVLDTRTTLQWTPQPAEAGTVRGELSWQAAQGTGARLASALLCFTFSPSANLIPCGAAANFIASPVAPHRNLMT